MKTRTKILIVIALLLLLTGIGAKLLLDSFGRDLEALADIPIADLSLADAADGTYEGSYSAFPVSAKVEVTLADHRITEIDLTEHRTGQGQDAEVLPDAVVAAQSLDVDIVSGATYSSVVILKAIEDALVSAGAKPAE